MADLRQIELGATLFYGQWRRKGLSYQQLHFHKNTFKYKHFQAFSHPYLKWCNRPHAGMNWVEFKVKVKTDRVKMFKVPGTCHYATN